MSNNFARILGNFMKHFNEIKKRNSPATLKKFLKNSGKILETIRSNFLNILEQLWKKNTRKF